MLWGRTGRWGLCLAAVVIAVAKAAKGQMLPPNACVVDYDTVAPNRVSVSVSVAQASSWPVPVTYWGGTDSQSGLEHVRLWFRKDLGFWQGTGLFLSTESGTFFFEGTLGDGRYDFAAKSTDKAGNAAPLSAVMATIVFDSVPPLVTLESLPSIHTIFEDLVIQGTASDDRTGLTAVMVRVNEEPWQSAQGTASWQASLRLAKGANRLEVVARDAAGNLSSSVGATILGSDNLPPVTPLNLTPGAGGAIWGLTPTLRASSFADPNGDTQGGSQWQVARDDEFSNLVLDSGVVRGTSDAWLVPSGYIDKNLRYWWRVRHMDALGAWSEWSKGTNFDTPAAFVAEEALPVALDGLPNTFIERTSPLAIRVVSNSALDQTTLWGAAGIGSNTVAGTWKVVPVAVDAAQAWMVFTPAAALPSGASLWLMAGGSTLDGRSFSTEPRGYTVGISMGSAVSSPTMTEVSNLEGIPKGLGRQASPVYRLSPSGVYDTPLTIRIPVESATAASGTDIFYYSESRLHRGWYKGANAIGFVVPGSRRVVTEGGQYFVQFQVNHSGVIQLGGI